MLERRFVAVMVSLATPLLGQAKPEPTVISNVAVVDVEQGRVLSGRTVVIADGRISAITGERSARGDGRRIDGRGKFLIPGLWDMHVHLSIPGGEALLGFYPGYGITGVRDMNDSFPQIQAWRRRIIAGELIGPRIVAAGPYLVGGRPPVPHFEVTSPASARAAVDSLHRLGVDFVKVHNEIPREAYFAIAERAKELGLSFSGHVPRAVTVIEASEAGQRSLEHLSGLANPCTPEDSSAIRPTPLIAFLLGPCSSASFEPIATRLIANGTHLTPTLTVFGALSGQPSPVDSLSRYRPAALRELQAMMLRLPPMSPEALDAARRLVAKRRELALLMYRAGVPLLAGSDAPSGGTFPGVSLHEELAAWVAAGIPAEAALRAATIGAARFLGLADSVGTIAVGRVADLVLLDGNPLADIGNARRVHAVWLGGRLVSPADRRAIFTRALAAAR